MLRRLVHSRQLLAHHFETSLTSFSPPHTRLFLLPCFLFCLDCTSLLLQLFILIILLLICGLLTERLPRLESEIMVGVSWMKKKKKKG